MQVDCPNCDADVDDEDLIDCEECGEVGCGYCMPDGLCEVCQDQRDDPTFSTEDDYDPEDYYDRD
jgi:hypothetical protein